VTATHKVTCSSCKGLGYHLAYVNEFAEMVERVKLWFRRTYRQWP
jgi:hypothetical protein